MRKSTLTLTLFLSLIFNQHLFSQSDTNANKWLIQAGLGVASDNDLGDSGVRLNTKIARHLGKRFTVGANFGAFHMTGVNEDLQGEAAILTQRSMSFFNIDILGGLQLLNKKNTRLELAAGPSYRNYRQLYPQIVRLQGGNITSIDYNMLKGNQIGFALVLSTDFRIQQNLWLGVEVNSLNYEFLGQLLGTGIRLSIGF
jgi:hypothetical protein